MAIFTRNKPSRSPSSAAGVGDLTRLLETETRLEEALRHARAEATRLVTEARAAAQAREEALGAELDAAARRLEGEIATERDRAERETADAARQEVARFDDVGAERIAELARRVVERVIGSET